MRIHSIHHVPFEGLGTISDFLKQRQLKHSATWLNENNTFPLQEDFDALIIMGGPMSVHDESIFSWLVLEKEFIKQTIDEGKPVLGFCLGAQLIAQVLGAEVKKAPYKEIGWFEIENCEHNTVLSVPDNFKAFHWHGEMFEVPQQALPLWYSEACQNQGFIYENIIAVQCHFEMTSKTAKALCEHCPDDMLPGEYVQNEQQILQQSSLFELSQQFLFNLLDTWLERPESYLSYKSSFR